VTWRSHEPGAQSRGTWPFDLQVGRTIQKCLKRIAVIGGDFHESRAIDYGLATCRQYTGCTQPCAAPTDSAA